MTAATVTQSVDAPEPAVDVPEGEMPPAACRHCDRPFRTERLLALHLGERHPDALDDAESAAYETARGWEDDDLFYYHAKVVGALGAIYSITVVVYMIAFGSGLI